MNKNKMPVTISLPINPDSPIHPNSIPICILELANDTIDFWLKKCRAESRFGEYKGKEMNLHIEINENGEKRFTLEVRGYFAHIILNENIDVILIPRYEESYFKKAFEHIAKNYIENHMKAT